MRGGMDRNTAWLVFMYVCVCFVVTFTTYTVTLMLSGDSYFHASILLQNVSKCKHLNV